jgi:Zn-dependent peptidase ImmA (M78 family)
MPKKMLIETINQYGLDLTDDEEIKKLAKKFKVSSVAMAYRISNLGIM